MKFTSKFLNNKKAWEDEHFQYGMLTFDITKAEQLIAANPHEAHVAPRNFLESFVGKTEVGESMEPASGFQSFDMLEHHVDKKHMQTVDEKKPGIVAIITYKPDKAHPEAKSYHILIDGAHRAKKSLILGVEFKVYVLTLEESWEVMAAATSPQILKGYVNPTQKPTKPRAKKPKAAALSDKQRATLIQQRLKSGKFTETDFHDCPDCEQFMDGEWRTGRCDDCRGSGRDDNDEPCVNCLGRGSPVCCRCEGTGIDPTPEY